MSNPTHIIVDKLDSDWCMSKAEEIIKDIPMSESSNASGKFFHNYKCWHFFKDTSLELIKEVNKIIEENAERFEKVFDRYPISNFAVLSVVDDASEEMCVWHKDGYFFNGQYHLTIEGHGDILVENENGIEEISVEPGTVWYLNGTEYRHKIKATSGRRIELCFPMNQRENDVAAKKECIEPNDPLMYVSGSNPKWIALREQQSEYVRQSVKNGKASNTKIAGFGLDGQT